MLTIVFVDDKRFYHHAFSKLLYSTLSKEGYKCDLVCFDNALSAIQYFSEKYFSNNRTSHIVILDGHLHSNAIGPHGPDIASRIVNDDNKDLIVSFSDNDAMTAEFSKILGDTHTKLPKQLSSCVINEKILPLVRTILEPALANHSPETLKLQR
ncbi:hypothetical protein ACFORL_01185 [Legionella dresdenensis]|uniref:Response regulatory domain-containing protein n=1 Tax=Legionella dresdenensis TaxID=450200 RepID=A0ABV8CBN0_9GAMM